MNYLKEVLKYDNEINEMVNLDDYIKVIEEYKSSQEIKRLKEMMKNEVDLNKKQKIADKIRLVKMGSWNILWLMKSKHLKKENKNY
mgnify:FL=1